MKVIFLDIDGVLNSNFWNTANQKEISDGTLIDQDKLKLLGMLVKDTNAKVILHSGWRFWFDSEGKPLRKEASRLKTLLNREKIEIFGFTPDYTTEEIRKTRKFSLVKAKEILGWIAEHEDVEAWAVLDDLDLHNEVIAKHQIRTDANVGLTIQDLWQARALLNI